MCIAVCARKSSGLGFPPQELQQPEDGAALQCCATYSREREAFAATFFCPQEILTSHWAVTGSLREGAVGIFCEPGLKSAAFIWPAVCSSILRNISGMVRR